MFSQGSSLYNFEILYTQGDWNVAGAPGGITARKITEGIELKVPIVHSSISITPILLNESKVDQFPKRLRLVRIDDEIYNIVLCTDINITFLNTGFTSVTPIQYEGLYTSFSYPTLNILSQNTEIESCTPRYTQNAESEITDVRVSSGLDNGYYRAVVTVNNSNSGLCGINGAFMSVGLIGDFVPKNAHTFTKISCSIS